MDLFVRNFVQKYQRVLRKSKPENLLKLLSAIEYTEAILEITAAKLFGKVFKWLIVFVTQLAKLQLLIFHKTGIQATPSLFNFSSMIEPKKIDGHSDEKKEGFFVLKHSGRAVRTIKNSPVNLENRDWTVPVMNESEAKNESQNKHFDPSSDKMRFLAEIIYIVRPICHITSMLIFKPKSWTQYAIAFSMDSTSLFLMNGTNKLSLEQKDELKRRTIALFYYLIRSPFYEFYSSSVINLILALLEQRIVGTKFIIKHIKEYIPYWQSIYNYCWTA